MQHRQVALKYMERIDACQATVEAVHDALRALMRFRRNEIMAHRDDVVMMRNSLTHILDSTEGK
jgi:hypothetical protein